MWTQERIEELIVGKLAMELEKEPQELDLETSLTRLGVDSLRAVGLLCELEIELGIKLDISTLLDASCVKEFASGFVDACSQKAPEARRPEMRVVTVNGDLPPLSAGQRAVWYVHELHEGMAAYNMPRAFRARKDLNVNALRRAFQRLMERHETLRTTFTTIDGLPYQQVHSSLELPFEVHDASSWSSEKLLDHLQEGSAHVFDLARECPLRMSVYETAPGDFTILFCGHHTAMDLWSLGILMRDIDAFYREEVEGRPTLLPPPQASYADFARQQAERISSGEMEPLFEYWQRELSGVPTVLNLPTDRPHPKLRSDSGSVVRFWLDDKQTAGLREIASRYDCTLYMALLAVYQTMLHRYSGQERLVVGTPMMARRDAKWAETIGYFTNLVPLQADFTGDPGFAEYLARVRKTVHGALDHQELPFSLLVERLRPEGERGRSPLVQAAFFFDRAPLINRDESTALISAEPGTGFDLGGVDYEAVTLEARAVQFDLGLRVVDLDDTILATIEYNTEIYDTETAECMAGHMSTLVDSLIARPEQPISELRLITDAERHQLIEQWNDTRKDYPREKRIPEFVEDQARERPEAIAVRDCDDRLTYRQLNERANRLAHLLISRGSGPGDLVGVLVERSPQMIVAALAVMKAGAAYIPLDASYPEARLSFMLEDSEVRLLLTERHAGKSFSDGPFECIYLDDAVSPIMDQPSTDPAGRGTSEDPAYAIYTSGSTGKPKAVVVPHRAATRLFFEDSIAVLPTDVMGATSSFSFDLSVWEIWGALAAGAQVALVSKETVASPQALAAQIDRDEITVTFMVPVVFNAFTREAPAALGRLHTLVVGGDVVDPHWVREALKATPPRRLLALYGPTETAVLSSIHLIDDLAAEATNVPLGRTISNTETYVLDSHLEPVPVGVSGEICIGGDAVALGYWKRPEQTAERFIVHPFRDEPSARLYRTGDIGRYRRDGTVEFLGRVDRQVKIRGFRIELGEVESAVAEHPTVAKTAVCTWEPEAGDRRLVAYVEPVAGQAVTPRELRKDLEGKLELHMVPSSFVILEKLPLTPNGKLDRKALPEPLDAGTATARGNKPAKTALEIRLHEIWCEVLGIESAGIDEEFFDLGGDSLKIARLGANISRTWNFEVSVQRLLLHPTIETQAAALEEGKLGVEGSTPQLHETGDGDVTSRTENAAQPQRQATAPPANGTSAPKSPHVKLDHRPFMLLFAGGEIPPVHAAAVTYLPNVLLGQNGLDRGETIERVFRKSPVFCGVDELPNGRIAHIMLPYFAGELYDDSRALSESIGEAAGIAKSLGARTLALTGLTASATKYGRTLKPVLAGRNLPAVTTGHATTASSLLLATQKILAETGRHLTGERVAFLGLGSVGTSTLHLMLSCLEHPRELMLCDLYEKGDKMQALEELMRALYGLSGRARVIPSEGKVPEEFYEATLIVAATNAADVLDVERLRPGTLIVDDSAPHCFTTADAIRRLESRQDLLFTEGGMLQLPEPVDQLRYMEPALAEAADVGALGYYQDDNPRIITSCVLSSLMSAAMEGLPITFGGAPKLGECRAHYQALTQLGAAAAPLHCESYVLPAEAKATFTEHYSGERI